MEKFSRIIVLVDGSEGSIRASDFAANLSETLGIPLTLTHVIPMTPESVMALAHLDKSEIESVQQRRAQDVLTSVREKMSNTAANVEEVVLSGDPAEEILHHIKSNADALVVMGRRGLSPVKTLMLGSVSDKVLRGAERTVILVN